MRRVAVTGGIATGKSTVLKIFADLGCRTISADAVSAGLWEDIAYQEEIAATLELDSPITKAEVRQAIENDPIKRIRLNSVAHPRILEALFSSNAEVFEVPLLVESCLQRFFEKILIVECSSETQLERLLERVGDLAAAEAAAKIHLDFEVKRAFADEVLRTDHELDLVVSNVRNIYDRWWPV